MNKALLCFGLLFSSIFVYAQKKANLIDWRPYFKSEMLHFVLGKDDTHMYFIVKGDIGILKVPLDNSDPKKIEQYFVSLPKKRSLEKIEMLDGNIFIFSSEKRDKIQYLYVNLFDKERGEIKEESHLLTSFDYSDGSFWNRGNFSVRTSQDQNRILAYYKLPYSKRENERFGLFVFDKSLELIWQRDIELPYEDKLFETQQFMVDNQGNVHLIARLYRDKKREAVKGEPNYAYHLLSYSAETTEASETVISLGDVFIIEMNISTKDGKNLYCIGFFSEDKSPTMKGIYALEIDPSNGDIIRSNTSAFSIDFITSMMSQKQAKRARKKEERGKKVELSNFIIDEIIFREDGGISLIGERRYFYEVSMPVTNSQGMVTHHRTERYYVNDYILVASLDSKLEMEWAKMVRKGQVSKGGFPTTGYMFMQDGDKLRFIFHDHHKNVRISNDPNEKMKNYTTGYKKYKITEAVVDGAGAVSYRVIHFDKRETYKVLPYYLPTPIFDDAFLIYSRERRKTRLGLYKF